MERHRMQALHRGQLKVFQLLLSHSTGTEIRDFDGQTLAATNAFIEGLPCIWQWENGGLRDFCSNMAQASMPGTRIAKPHSRQLRRQETKLLREHMLRQ